MILCNFCMATDNRPTYHNLANPNCHICHPCVRDAISKFEPPQPVPEPTQTQPPRNPRKRTHR